MAQHHKRTAHRWRLMSLMLAGVFFASGSFWLLQMMRNQEVGVQAGARHNEPDYIVDNFSLVRMTPAGQPRYVVSGSKLTHRPVDDVSEVERPVVQSMATEHPRMTMHANRAHIRHADNQVDLVGNVDIDRPGTPTSKALRIRTEAMTVLPDEEVLKTDKPVDMKIGATTVRGTGMVANNATQQLHLASRGQIVYPPRQDR